MELFRGLQRSTVSYCISILAISFSLLHVVPNYLRILGGRCATSVLTTTLESDLLQLGTAPQLQRKVECFDLVFGCLNALYHLQVVGNSGFTGDLLFFSHTNTVASDYYKQRFWSNAEEHPPEVIVVSNEWFGHANSFDKLQAWPEFQSYLNNNYRVFIARSFRTELIGRGQPLWDPAVAPAYRIYVRHHNGS